MKIRELDRRVKRAVEDIFWEYCRSDNSKEVLANIKVTTLFIHKAAKRENKLSDKAKIKEYLI